MADKFSLADFAQKTLEVKFCGDSARSAGEKNLSRRLRGFRAESSRTIFSAVICDISGRKKPFPPIARICAESSMTIFSAVIRDISGRKKPFPQIAWICAETYPNIFLYGDSAISAGL
jgi:hypothetical protein